MFDYFYGQSGEMFSYFRVPKILFRDIRFKDLSTDAKTLYGILLDRMSLSVKNGWLDGQGRVYIIFPIQEVMDALGCADNKATKLFRELENAGLVERKRRDDKPAEVVRSRLKKLNADHIRFVLDSLAESTAPVRNMKQYLLAMLYNAPTTMNLYLNKQNIAPSIENYELLYRGNLPEGKRSVPQAELLEQLYQKFNFARPTDYHGHSLSVSDVIMLNQDGKISAYYVDSIGFKELPGFLDKKQERTSVLMNLREKCDAPECNPTGCRKARDEHEL